MKRFAIGLLFLGAYSLCLPAQLASASRLTVIYHFRNNPKNGIKPAAGLIYAGGLLYGTTELTGQGKYGNGPGSVFSVDPSSGAETAVHIFDGSDGANPEAGLINVNGILYGTTVFGGKHQSGTVFSLDPSTGAEEPVHSFKKDGTDGVNPYASLIYADGALFGTTASGGAYNHGTVFRLTTDGAETVVHSFSGPDGANPVAALLKAGGVMFGTTSHGGKGCSSQGCGVIFEIARDGVFSVLYKFPGDGSGGANPVAPLITAHGLLYGTTEGGGTDGGGGTVFSLDPATGEQAVLHSFSNEPPGSIGPNSVLLAVGDELYGTSIAGALNHNAFPGSIFEVNRRTGKEKDLHFFGGSKGANPMGGLIDVNGVLYGTTYDTTCCNGVIRGGWGAVYAFKP